MTEQKAPTFMVEDAQLIFRNFAGEARRFNEKGDRQVTVILPPDVAAQMEADGWNVKYLDPRDEGDEPRAIIRVAIRFDPKPPKIVMITSKSRTFLTSSTLEVLDYADLATVDLIATGYKWEVNGKTGIKAYLKTMFVTIDENELERKYDMGGMPIQGSMDIDDIEDDD